MTRRVGVVTGARSDYGLMRPVMGAIHADPGLELQLLVTGGHLAPAFGLTISDIERDGFPIAERVDAVLASDSASGVAKSMGLVTLGLAQAFRRLALDWLVLLGDRYEMHAAAVAAVPFNLPLAHIHGGEVTEGAIDDAFRHSLTKLSHLHFVATDVYARRVVQMGEEPWRVTVSGAPGLDNVRQLDLLSRDEVFGRLGVAWAESPLLVTFHPVTRQPGQAGRHMDALLEALEGAGRPVIFTYPGADFEASLIIERIEQFAKGRDDVAVAPHLGTRLYFSLMAQARAMVGNSSSGIVEAASFALPVVNVGSRQAGRVRGPNVIDAACQQTAIAEAVGRATSGAFRDDLRDMTNPYGDGRAAARIVERLRDVPIDQRLLRKRFHDATSSEAEE